VKVKLQEINLYKSGMQENNAKSTENTKYIYSSAFNDLNLYIPQNSMAYRKNNSMMFKGNSTVAKSLFWKMWTSSEDSGVKSTVTINKA